MYPGVGAFVLIRPAQTFYERIKLSIFPLLEEGPRSSDDVARHLGAAPRFVQAFLDACVALEKQDETFRNAPLTSKFLIRGNPEYVGDLVLHITNHWLSWGQLDQLILEGRTLLPFESGYVDVPTYWTNYMTGQNNRAVAGQNHYLVQGVDLWGRRKLLDLGGGAASYSVALCNANPELQAVVIDGKEPLELARTIVEEHQLQGRIHLREGDFTTLDLGTDNDVVLISGVVLIKSEAENRKLLQLAYDAMVPGGLIIVQDFMRMDTSLVLGYGDLHVRRALQEQLVMGTCFPGPTELQVRLAQMLCERTPSLERVRFTNSGTEATMNALRATRAFTGRRVVAKAEGAFHGTHDLMEVSIAPDPQQAGPADRPRPIPHVRGVPEEVFDDVLIIPFNDPASACRLIEERAREVACVIVEPVMGSAGMLPASHEYLQALREVTERLGALLVFDEVITYRIALGGAQEYYGVRPDLTCLGKMIGGGLPLETRTETPYWEEGFGQ